jgi:hypothetical protein
MHREEAVQTKSNWDAQIINKKISKTQLNTMNNG